MAGARRGTGSVLALILGTLTWLLSSSAWQAFSIGAARSAKGTRQLSVAAAAQGVATTPAEAKLLEETEAVDKARAEAVQQAALEKDSATGENMGTFWVNQPGQIAFEVQWNRGDRIRDLKAVIFKVTGIPPEKQELRSGQRTMGMEGFSLEGLDLSDVWLLDDRDESEKRGEYNPNPEEDMSLLANPSKAFIWVFAAFITLFWVTQMLEINPYANFPEGPREDWSKVPEDLRPGNEPIQMGYFQLPAERRSPPQADGRPGTGIPLLEGEMSMDFPWAKAPAPGTEVPAGLSKGF